MGKKIILQSGMESINYHCYCCTLLILLCPMLTWLHSLSKADACARDFMIINCKRFPASECFEIKSAEPTCGARYCFLFFSMWVVCCDSQDHHYCRAETSWWCTRELGTVVLSSKTTAELAKPRSTCTHIHTHWHINTHTCIEISLQLQLHPLSPFIKTSFPRLSKAPTPVHRHLEMFVCWYQDTRDRFTKGTYNSVTQVSQTAARA